MAVVECLNGQVTSDDVVDPCRWALVCVEAGDQVDDLDGWLFTLGSYGRAGELADLLGSGPG